MDYINWLLTLAGRHESIFKDKIRELRQMKVRGRVVPQFDELQFNTELVTGTDSMPAPLSELSPLAILALSYFTRETLGGDNHIQGKEIVNKLSDDGTHTSTYLFALEELKDKSWMNLELDREASIQMKPYTYLTAKLEFGESFSKLESSISGQKNNFSNNVEYLDAVFNYLNDVTERPNKNRPKDFDDLDKLPFKPDKYWQRILNRVENTQTSLPAVEITTTYRLSSWQYLFLMGLLGVAEKAVDYDFDDVDEVVSFFCTGYAKRSKMKSHLVGDKSVLITSRLIEGREGNFGKSYKISSLASRLLLGKKNPSKSLEDLKRYISKTIFDVEKPKVKADGLLLPPKIMDTIRTILHAESPAGKKSRATLRKFLPAEVGCPVGTTILLHGSAGTGKTLTAQYIASSLNVPLLKVDCSQILGMFVGQSEKNVKRIFNDYEDICANTRSTPVLLLNEADQLLGDRIGAKTAVDRMNNNIQNLFLEGLERFNGILIATTNRKDLLDSAFSRRFTYKLELPKPDTELRRRIWEQHIPKKMIADSIDYDRLAVLPLSGGEIRLVLEQAVRSAAYNGFTVLDSSLLMEIAQAESSAAGNKVVKRFGFHMD